MREKMSYTQAYFNTLTDADKAYLAAAARELIALHDAPQDDKTGALYRCLVTVLHPALEAMARDGYQPPMSAHMTPLQIRQRFGGQ